MCVWYCDIVVKFHTTSGAMGVRGFLTVYPHTTHPLLAAIPHMHTETTTHPTAIYTTSEHIVYHKYAQEYMIICIAGWSSCFAPAVRLCSATVYVYTQICYMGH